ncbi:Carboxypeptidase -like protein [Trichinella zimbabwensis]|uniref:Carboxypeptidase-like protein n=1 Tax=Trichinella zimbabwensis TaxID=268475 RepID=A0A0V1I776_9BILA|nr:Carboxypeptidase -like protein [Trichinella zimbabwensis]
MPFWKCTLEKCFYFWIIVLFYQFCLLKSFPLHDPIGSQYHSNKEIAEQFLILSRQYPNQLHQFFIGKSVYDQEIVGVAVSAQYPEQHISLRPNILFTANIHGNEPVGREILIKLVTYVLQNYGKDPLITQLLNETRLLVIPTLNPDGFDASILGDCYGVEGRTNANGIDLNRNYPNIWKTTNDAKNYQPETLAFMSWIEKIPVILSMDIHGGSLVVNYPYDSRVDARSVYSAAPDDDVLKHLALSYSQNNLRMSQNSETWCPLDSERFKDGITNGANWYSIEGSLQDYMYSMRGSMALTLEMSCCKYPNPEILKTIWNENLPSLLQFWKQALTGIKGIVRNADSAAPIEATLKIVGRDISFSTTKNGEFYRILLPGKYRLIVDAPLFKPSVVDFVLTEQIPYVETNQKRSENSLYGPNCCFTFHVMEINAFYDYCVTHQICILSFRERCCEFSRRKCISIVLFWKLLSAVGMTVTSYSTAKKERNNYLTPVEGDTSSSGATESDYQEFSSVRPTSVRNFRQTSLEIFFSNKFQVLIVFLVTLDCICLLAEVLIHLRMFELGNQSRVMICILHYFNICVLSLFFVELVFKLFVMGFMVFKYRMEMFDFIVIILSFSLSIIYGDCGRTADGAGLLISFRLWRILRIFKNVVASVKMEAQRKIRKEGRTKKALQREVCKLREYCLKQEYELQFYRLILQQNRIPLPTVLRIPRSPLIMSVTAEVNEHCLKSFPNDESYICEKSSSNTEE